MPEFLHSAITGRWVDDPSDYRGESSIAVPLEGRWVSFFESPQPVTSLAVLSALSQRDFELLSRQPNLRELQLGGPQMTTLDPLGGLPHLRALNLSGVTNLSDVSALASLPSLERLAIHGATALLQYRQLAQATSLHELWLSAGPRDLSWLDIDDLEWITGLRALEKIQFTGIRVRNKDLSPLTQLPALARLHLPQRRDYRAQIDQFAAHSAAFRAESERFAENEAALRAMKGQHPGPHGGRTGGAM